MQSNIEVEIDVEYVWKHVTGHELFTNHFCEHINQPDNINNQERCPMEGLTRNPGGVRCRFVGGLTSCSVLYSGAAP